MGAWLSEILEHWPEDEKAPDRTSLSKRLHKLEENRQVMVVETREKGKKAYGLVTEAREIQKQQYIDPKETKDELPPFNYY